MNQNKKRIFGAILLSVLCASSIAPGVYATEAEPAATESRQETTQQQTGTTLIAVTSSNINVGDELGVTIRGSISSTLTLKFNPAILKYKSSSPTASIADNVVTFNGKECVVKFEAIEAGSSGLILGGPNLAGCSTIIQVGNGTSTQQDADTTDETETEGSDGGEESEPVESSTFGTADRYISIMEPETLPSDMLESRKLETVEGAVVNAYQLEGGSNEFYYMYGTDEKDNLGWFIYDSSEQTISRIDSGLFENVSHPEQIVPEKKDDEGLSINVSELLADRKVWAVLIFVGAAFIALIVNLIARGRSRDEYDSGDESATNVSQVHRSYEDHESAAMVEEADTATLAAPAAAETPSETPAQTPAEAPAEAPAPEPVASEPWEEDDDEKYNLKDDDSGAEAAKAVHEIIGEKRVDIMDLNDL